MATDIEETNLNAAANAAFVASKVDKRRGTRIGDEVDRLHLTAVADPSFESSQNGLELGPYRVEGALGVGPDGAAFLARADQRLWEVRRLDLATRDGVAANWLRRRLAMLAKLPSHPAIVPMRLHADATPPLVGTAWTDRRPLSGFLAGHDTLDNDRAIGNLASIADALSAAHRLGVAHGALDSETVFVESDGQWTVDFTGVACFRGIRSQPDADAFSDIGNLGALIGQIAPLLRGLKTVAIAGPAEKPTVDALAHLQEIVAAMSAESEVDRLHADEAARRLAELAARCSKVGVPRRTSLMERPDDPGLNAVTFVAEPETIGRYRLTAKLGEGGMGSVYRAVDEVDGSVVAIKLLNEQRCTSPAAFKRFMKEGRMLARVASPHVTRLLEANHDRGRYYLALEYVEGRNLGQVLADAGQLEERRALAIAVDVARGLAAAHAQRIIHRDVKPENVLLIEGADRNVAKITDFGLAREVVQTDSLQITRAGSILGTPLYMAPEQFIGSEPEDARTDVYAFGATLFHMLAGRPPFVGQTFQELLMQHTTAAPPSLVKLAPTVSGAVARIIERCLSKKSADRYVDADAVLAELELALRGQPSPLASHPVLPQTDKQKILEWVFQWELKSTPAELWPLVSNTERVNRAMGLPAVVFDTKDREKGGSRRFGSARIAGLRLSWEEHPFEWIEGKRMGILREFSSGPFVWFTSIVEFATRPTGGTTLTQTVRIEPRGLAGRLVGAIEIGYKARRALDGIYRRLDQSIQSGGGPSDPFERPTRLNANRQRRLWAKIPALVADGAAADIADCLGLYLSNASAQEVARIRPIVFARRFRLDANAAVETCLRAVQHGLLALRWDVLCPMCQIASTGADALKSLKEHEHCPACNVGFATDLNRGVEMVFHVHPDIREAEFGAYCAGGPAHSPHVAAQARVAPHERMELALDLAIGAYCIRGPQLPWSLELDVSPVGAARRHEIVLTEPQSDAAMPPLLPGGQHLVLDNRGEVELIVRVERVARRDDAVTAAAAMAMPLFRSLFPGDVLAPDRLAQIASVSVLMTQLADGPLLYARLGDADAHALVQRAFRLHDELVRKHRGIVVKTVSEGVLAIFQETAAAALAATQLQATLANDELAGKMQVRASLYRGLATVTSLDGRLDYVGGTIKRAIRLLERAGAGHLVVAEEVATDPEIDALFQRNNMACHLIEVRDLIGDRNLLARRYALPTA